MVNNNQQKPLSTNFQTDKTIGGNNYYYTNPDEQGKNNSLVNTGAVAGINEQPAQQTGKKASKRTALNIAPTDNNKSVITDQTIGGYNYAFYDPNKQGQNNSLVNTGAVAGMNTLPTPPTLPKTGRKVSERENRDYDPNMVENPNEEKPKPQQPQKQPIQQSTPQEQNTPEMNITENTVEEPQEEQPMEEVEENLEPQTEEEQEPQELATIDQENKEGTIYGRASGESQQQINTNADQFSADQIIQMERQRSLNNLQGMDSYNIAVSIANGYTPMGEQAMRDLQQYDPQKYNEIQEQLKTIQKGEIANQIATNGKIDITGQIKNTTDTINNDIDNRAKKNSTPESYSSTLSSLTDKLASSQTAQTATQEMLNINKDIAEIQEQMNNLPNEAKKVFKGDVPQYLVDAYISNKSQELQSQLNKLQSRYQSATDLYKTEVAQKQWETEMEFKNRQFQADQIWKQFDYNFKMQQQNRENNFKTNQFNRQVGQQDFKNQLDLQQFQLSSIKTDSLGRPYQLNQDGTYTYLQDNTAQILLNQQRQNAVSTLMATNHDGEWGGQCEAFTNRYLEQVYGTRFQGKNGYTTAEEKIGYVNTNEPVIGSIAIFDYGIKDKVTGENYGHTMVVTGYDPNTGTVTLKGSNKSSKPNEKEKIYTSTVNISQLNGGALKGFYDPLLDRELDNNTVVDESESIYTDYYNTPMREIFTKAYDEASTKDLKDQISNAEDSYAIINELVRGGYINRMVNSEDFYQLIADIEKGKFTDSQGNISENLIQNYCINQLKDEDLAYAMSRVQRLIEKKLRRESGAAIAQSEWNSNFGMYLKSAGESPDLALKKLQDFERDIIGANLPTPYRSKIIQLISDELPTGLEDQLEDIINDNRKTGQTAMKLKPYKYLR